MEHVVLNNGVKMPQVGLGTFLIPKEEIAKTITAAYDMGYRQFDTAWRYHNERDIADALRSHGVKREEVFITTKVNVDALYRFGYHEGKRRVLNIIRRSSIKRAVQESFDNLGMEYIDLFLVHYPWPQYLDMYEELTRLHHEGRIRAIGVSNMLPPHIEALQNISDIVPAVNQVEISPLNTQKQLIGWCQSRGIVVEAMSTFSHFRSVEPRMEIIGNEKLADIAAVHGKSVVQVVLRWLIQQGVIVIPKTWNMEHLRENINVFDFQLSTKEMEIIDSLDCGRFLNYNPYAALKNIPKP